MNNILTDVPATATRPWILVLDSNERIAAKDLSLVVAATSAEADGFYCVQRTYVRGNDAAGWTANTGEYDEGAAYSGYVDRPAIRLFRNSPDFELQAAVQCVMDPARFPTGCRLAESPIVIHHYGRVRHREYVTAQQLFNHDLGLRKIQEDPSNLQARFDLGVQCQEMCRHIEAAEWFEQVFEFTAESSVLFHWAISERHLRHYDRAEELLRQAIGLGLDTPAVHMELGNVYLMCHRNHEADTQYKYCLTLDPSNPAVLFNCGLALKKLGEVGEAQQFFERALDLAPAFREAALQLASLKRTMQRYPDALSLTRPVVEQNVETVGKWNVDSSTLRARRTATQVH